MSLVLSTDAVTGGDRLAYWSEALGRALVPVRVGPVVSGPPRAGAQCPAPFAGRVEAGRVGQLRVAAVEADAHRAERTARHIAGAAEEFVGVSVQLAGTSTLEQGGRRTVAGRGDLLVYDTGRPYSLAFAGRAATRVVHVPRHVLGLPDDEVERATGGAIDGAEGFGAVLAGFVSNLVDSARACSPAVANRLAAGVVDLFAALLTEAGGRPGAATEDGRVPLVGRVRAHIERELADPGLSPESVARAHHISVRYLHRLFQDEGITVTRLIQRSRLERCAHELGRPGRAASPVAAVAQRWGFVNPAHFSRVFRAAYGVSPREWRARAAA